MSERGGYFEHLGSFLKRALVQTGSTAYSVLSFGIVLVGGSALALLLVLRGLDQRAVLLGFVSNLALLIFLMNGAFLAYRDERRTRLASVKAMDYNRQDNTYRHREIRIQDLVSAIGSTTLSGFTFEDCQILGPALLVVHDDCSLRDSRIRDGPGFGMQAIWRADLDPVQYQKTGCLSVVACHFLRCTFVDIGISGSEQFLARLKDQLQRKGNGTVASL